jgi:plastocyanin domain-containing protein
MGIVMLSSVWMATNLSASSKSPVTQEPVEQMGCPCCSGAVIPEEPITTQATPKAVTETPSPATQQVQVINSTLNPRRYPDITVKKGIPVRWVIDAPQGSIHGCNNRIIIPEYDIEYSFKYGENVIEFTPVKAGKFRYSCWMYMMFGNITVEG